MYLCCIYYIRYKSCSSPPSRPAFLVRLRSRRLSADSLLNDWLFDWSSDWLIDYTIGRLIHCLVVWLIDWSHDWQSWRFVSCRLYISICIDVVYVVFIIVSTHTHMLYLYCILACRKLRSWKPLDQSLTVVLLEEFSNHILHSVLQYYKRNLCRAILELGMWEKRINACGFVRALARKSMVNSLRSRGIDASAGSALGTLASSARIPAVALVVRPRWCCMYFVLRCT